MIEAPKDIMQPESGEASSSAPVEMGREEREDMPAEIGLELFGAGAHMLRLPSGRELWLRLRAWCADLPAASSREQPHWVEAQCPRCWQAFRAPLSQMEGRLAAHERSVQRRRGRDRPDDAPAS